jgi:hypothetical protein
MKNDRSTYGDLETAPPNNEGLSIDNKSDYPCWVHVLLLTFSVVIVLSAFCIVYAANVCNERCRESACEFSDAGVNGTHCLVRITSHLGKVCVLDEPCPLSGRRNFCYLDQEESNGTCYTFECPYSIADEEIFLVGIVLLSVSIATFIWFCVHSLCFKWRRYRGVEK